MALTDWQRRTVKRRKQLLGTFFPLWNGWTAPTPRDPTIYLPGVRYVARRAERNSRWQHVK